MSAFTEFLNDKGIAYIQDASTDALEVQGSLFIKDACTLPDHLTVRGALWIEDRHRTSLPDHLTVLGHVLLQDTAITTLPATMRVGEDISLLRSQVSSLPRNLNVPGVLDAHNTPLAELPEGLVVGGLLDLRGTPIRRLPPDLRVHGLIRPPEGLLDLQAFMAKGPDAQVLECGGSCHDRMELRARLDPFPDLWTAVAAMQGMRMQIRRHADGTCGTWFE